MLRITTIETTDRIRLQLEGKLSGPWVTELEHLYALKRAKRHPRSFVLDLKDLTGTDNAGRYLLALIRQEGANLENADPLCGLLWSVAGAEVVN